MNSQPYKDTLSWMAFWKGEDKRETFVLDIAEDYRKAHPNTYLKLKFAQDVLGNRSHVDLAWNISFMITTQNYEWDIVQVNSGIYQVVAENLGDLEWGAKYLIDFGKIPGFKESHHSFIFDTTNYSRVSGKTITGPFFDGFYVPLWYNKDVAEKIGIKIKERGMTYKDFEEYIKEVDDYNKEHKTGIAAIYESFDQRSIGKFLFQHLFVSEMQDYSKVVSDNYKEEKLNALKKVLNSFEELSKYKPLGEGYDTNQWFNTRNLVLENKYLFYISGSWMYSHWSDVNKELMQKMVPAEMPVYHEIDYYLGGYNPTLAVFKNAPNKEKAIELIMGICNEKYADKWIDYTKTPCGLKGTLQLKNMEHDVYKDFNDYINEKYGARLYRSQNTKYVFGNDTDITSHFLFEVLIKILSGEYTAEFAKKQFIKE